jgi:hypothetical protein
MPKKKRCYRTQEIAQERNGVTEEEEGREGIVCTSPGVGCQSQRSSQEPPITWRTRRHQSRSTSAQRRWPYISGPHGEVEEGSREPQKD